MQKETQSIEWTVATDEESQWSIKLTNAYQDYRHSGWQFVTTLNEGVNKFIEKHGKETVYDIAQQSTGLSRSRLQNLVSMANKPSSRYAAANGLEIAHAEAVLGLPEPEAIKYLDHAIAEGKSATAIGAMIRDDRQARTAKPNTSQPSDLPDSGNERHPDDEPPFARTANNPLYDDYDTEADALAGNSAAYDFGDDEDGYTYTGAEFMTLMQRATNRLRDTEMWQEQRTVNEWLAMVARHTY